MKKAHFLYINYLTPDGEKMSVGGIQTYLHNLSDLLVEMGYEVNIYQCSKVPFKKSVGKVNVTGVVTNATRGSKIGHTLFNECVRNFDRKNDILLFGSDDYICSTDGIPFIAIQHGITWDIPVDRNRIFFMLKKFYRGCLIVNRVEKASLLVCVDSNFINWYRAMVEKPRVKLLNIPNFTEIAPVIQKPDDGKIRIIFARRFFYYRGTRIFAKAVKRLLEEFDNLEITFAGEGPDKGWLTEQFNGNPAVKFITYASDESMEVHKNKDIAVVPTLGSEGTSLSLLEAMSAQCAVLCTNVGGMTDIVFNDYNGLIVNPDDDSIYRSLRELVEKPELRKRLAQNGYDIVRECFSKEKWMSRWKLVLEEFVARQQG